MVYQSSLAIKTGWDILKKTDLKKEEPFEFHNRSSHNLLAAICRQLSSRGRIHNGHLDTFKKVSKDYMQYFTDKIKQDDNFLEVVRNWDLLKYPETKDQWDENKKKMYIRNTIRQLTSEEELTRSYFCMVKSGEVYTNPKKRM